MSFCYTNSFNNEFYNTLGTTYAYTHTYKFIAKTRNRETYLFNTVLIIPVTCREKFYYKRKKAEHYPKSFYVNMLFP